MYHGLAVILKTDLGDGDSDGTVIVAMVIEPNVLLKHNKERDIANRYKPHFDCA